MDIQKRRVKLFVFVAGIIVLSITAEKCRQLVGEDSSSQSGKFTIFNCFDMGTGTLACTVKEGVKLYFYNIRSAHVESARNLAIERALLDALGQGIAVKDATKQAQKEGAKAAKLAARKAKRIIGPIISSGWDFFEAIYYGGTITEGFLRGSGTLGGAYAGGFFGEQSLGRFGYLVGSHLGSWVGGRIGLMVYDVISGVHFLIQFVNPEDSRDHETLSYEESEGSPSSYVEAEVGNTSPEVSEDPGVYATPTYENIESYEQSYESIESYEQSYESTDSYEQSEL